jgi:hypothetical protein
LFWRLYGPVAVGDNTAPRGFRSIEKKLFGQKYRPTRVGKAHRGFQLIVSAHTNKSFSPLQNNVGELKAQ